MKKVFAFLSTLLLTIAMVGVVAAGSHVKAASDKITVDPTLAEDEIPVYIMDSIYSTFPNYYDNEAKSDPNWAGPARMYPWNETRLRVAQIGADGQPTGKYYAVYFAGHTVAVEKDGNAVVGAGKNILFWDVDESGNVIAVKYSDGRKAASGNASDPSLSHMRTNISGKDLEFDPTTLGMNDEGTNFYNRSIVFNANGQVIRGIALDSVYTEAEAAGVKFLPEYGYVNGVVKKIEEGDVVDKIKQPKVDEEGNPVLDEDGNQIYEDTDRENRIYSRFVWEFMTTKPENVNTVPYLSAGWDATLWDYCYEQDGGYMCIAFVGSADNTVKVKGDQVGAYTNTLKARYIADGMSEEEALAKATADAGSSNRTCVKTLRIPAGGFTFDYGYLDKGKETNDQFFNETVINGYLYGRQLVAKKYTSKVVDEDGTVHEAGSIYKNEEGSDLLIGLAEQKTYNFSVSGLKFVEKVIDGQSYVLLNGQNTVEVMMGSEFNPAQSINYNGVMRYWAKDGDLLSYTASADALELYITTSQNGGSALSKVEPATGYGVYKSIDEAKDAFLKDVAAWAKKDVSEIKFDTAANFQSNFSWGQFFPTNAGNAGKLDYPSAEQPSFWNVPANREKWGWLVEKIYETMVKYPGGDTYTASLDYVKNAKESWYCGSPQTIAYAFWYFLTGQQHGYFGFNFQDGHNTEWIDARTNVEKWNDYKIDATTAAPDDNWVVTYRVVNTATKNESSMTVKYVVVDSYTPTISVNADKLFIKPKQVGDLLVIDPINKYELVKAYNGQYNGVDIKGNDITHRVEFDTELNFDSPKEGTFPVVATVWNNAHTKSAQVRFQVEIFDMTRPNVITRNVTILQGQDFDVRDGIAIAVDNVDGDLRSQTYQWWNQTSKAIDTTKMDSGKTTRTENVKVEVIDRAGNTTTVTFKLTIVSTAGLTAKDVQDIVEKAVSPVTDSVDDLAVSVEEMFGGLTQEVKDSVANKATSQEVRDLATKLDALSDKVNAKGCKSGAAVALALASVVTLVAVVVRKRH